MKKQVINFHGEAVGALVQDGERFRFVAVKFSVWSLDGRLFYRPVDAQRVVNALLSQSGGKAMPAASFWVPDNDDVKASQFAWNATSSISTPNEAQH